jgi:vitamin B12 transporter
MRLFGVENERFGLPQRLAASSLARNADPGAGAGQGRTHQHLWRRSASSRSTKGLTLNGGVRHDDHQSLRRQDPVLGRRRVWRLADRHGAARELWRRLQGADAVSVLQRIWEYRAQSRSRRMAGKRVPNSALWDGKLVSFGATWFERRTTQPDHLRAQLSPSAHLDRSAAVARGTTTAFRFGYYQNVARAFAHGIEATAALKPSAGCRSTAITAGSHPRIARRAPPPSASSWRAARATPPMLRSATLSPSALG